MVSLIIIILAARFKIIDKNSMEIMLNENYKNISIFIIFFIFAFSIKAFSTSMITFSFLYMMNIMHDLNFHFFIVIHLISYVFNGCPDINLKVLSCVRCCGKGTEMSQLEFFFFYLLWSNVA